MFKSFSLLALLVAPLASALTLQVPTNPTSSGTITVNWTTQANDPEFFSLELINVAFNNAFAIANNVDSSLQTLTLTLPVVPVGDGYTLQAVNVGNINDVFSTTASFAIAAATTTLATTVPATTISLSRTSTGTGNNTATTTGTGTRATTQATTTPLSTNTNSNTVASNTVTSPAGNPTSFNTGAGSALNVPGAGLAAALAAGVLAVL